ncbi:hypothetical protein C8J57DRAFT_1242568 [Mycena rebaudengoi]|nr:hypothetical protein C8J57DRAFT_1242568 [Mycena rebaudengoi]
MLRMNEDAPDVLGYRFGEISGIQRITLLDVQLPEDTVNAMSSVPTKWDPSRGRLKFSAAESETLPEEADFVMNFIRLQKKKWCSGTLWNQYGYDPSKYRRKLILPQLGRHKEGENRLRTALVLVTLDAVYIPNADISARVKKDEKNSTVKTCLWRANLVTVSEYLDDEELRIPFAKRGQWYLAVGVTEDTNNRKVRGSNYCKWTFEPVDFSWFKCRRGWQPHCESSLVRPAWEEKVGIRTTRGDESRISVLIAVVAALRIDLNCGVVRRRKFFEIKRMVMISEQSLQGWKEQSRLKWGELVENMWVVV